MSKTVLWTCGLACGSALACVFAYLAHFTCVFKCLACRTAVYMESEEAPWLSPAQLVETMVNLITPNKGPNVDSAGDNKLILLERSCFYMKGHIFTHPTIHVDNSPERPQNMRIRRFMVHKRPRSHQSPIVHRSCQEGCWMFGTV